MSTLKKSKLIFLNKATEIKKAKTLFDQRISEAKPITFNMNNPTVVALLGIYDPSTAYPIFALKFKYEDWEALWEDEDGVIKDGQSVYLIKTVREPDLYRWISENEFTEIYVYKNKRGRVK